MPNLKDLQNQFVDAIYSEKYPKILGEIKAGKISQEQLLDIYRNNSHSVLYNVLKITYPLIFEKIGAEKFREFGEEFLKNQRSYSNNLDEFGEEFSDFFANKNAEFLSDLAKLEWRKQQSYLAKDAPDLDVSTLQQLKPEQLFDLKFKLHPSCFFVMSNFDLLSHKKIPVKQKRKIYFVIFRGREVTAQKLSKSEFNFLSGVNAGLTLFEIYEKFKIDIQNCLQKYIQNGVLRES